MPRRMKGMFQRGRTWCVRLYQGGRERWVSLGTDYEEACRRLRRIRAGESPPSSLSVAEVARKWLEVYVATRRNARGKELAAARVRLYLVPLLGWKLLDRVTSDDLRSYRLALERRSISPQTVAHLCSDVRCFFGWCADSGLVAKSPVPRRFLPRIPERPPDRLSDEEVERLIALSDPHGFVIRFALATGLRWGELCRAQASDIDKKGMLVVSQTKSGKVRRVPLSREILREIRGRVGRIAGRIGPLVPFSAESHGSFNAIVRHRSGVARFHVHQCRHTFACKWADSCGNIAALQEVMGHASIKTTQRYARLSEDAVRAEAARVFGDRP